MQRLLDPARLHGKARSLTDELVNELARHIRDGVVQPGQRLPTEAEFMAGYGVSRSVVREAISRLQAAHLVETRHGIGTFVIEAANGANFRIEPADVATIADVLLVLELRISVEVEAAALAAERRSAEQLADMRAALDQMNAAIDGDGDAVEPDFRFHLLVAQSTENRHFADLMAHLGTMLIPRTRVNSAQLAHEERPAYLHRVNQEHERIFAAIEVRDGDAARAAMRRHLANSRERLRRAQAAAQSA